MNYVELPANNFDAIKTFFCEVFNWSFIDYGRDDIAFADQGLDGGFYRSKLISSSTTIGALIVFYSQSLEQTLQKIDQAGGIINKSIFELPSGRRFHFCEPHCNEYAVWSDLKTMV